MCGRCISIYYVETDRHLKVRSGEHVWILTMAFKKNKLSKEIAICDTLFNYNKITSFEEFTILGNRNNNFVIEIK